MRNKFKAIKNVIMYLLHLKFRPCACQVNQNTCQVDETKRQCITYEYILIS